jgi:hypothetical protein
MKDARGTIIGPLLLLLQLPRFIGIDNGTGCSVYCITRIGCMIRFLIPPLIIPYFLLSKFTKTHLLLGLVCVALVALAVVFIYLPTVI